MGFNDDATVLISKVFDNQAYAGGAYISSPVTDGINTLGTAPSHYFDDRAVEILSGSVHNNDYDSVTNGIAFDNRFLSSKNLAVPLENTVNGTQSDFVGIECVNLVLNGVIGGHTGTAVTTAVGFSGNAVPAYSIGYSGTNLMLGVWNFMPRGGDGGGNTTYAGGLGGVGFTGSGGGDVGYQSNGGKLIFIVADDISGRGTFRATSANTPSSHAGSGGGGIIILITKTWAGTNGIDVSTGSVSGSGIKGQEGSYAILKLNEDNTLTLMVHSQNGVSAVLNGQTPVHGADASIAW